MQKTSLTEIKTASFTVTALDSGKVFFLNAADLVVTLPATVAGLHYKFITQVLSGGTGTAISPAAADSINFGTDNKDLENSTDALGDYCEVWGDGSVGWHAETQGTWTEES